MLITIILALVLGDSLKKSFTTSLNGFSFFSLTLTVLGFILLGVAVLAFISKNLKIITFSTLPVMLAILGVAVFGLVVSSSGEGHSIPGQNYSYKEYELTSYSKWMQKKVNDSTKWQTYYKTAIIENSVCSILTNDHKSDNIQQFHFIGLSSLQSGCCKPPEKCNFTFVTPTNWTSPSLPKGGNYSEVDCNNWNNNTGLCYDCDSCKAGFLQDVKKRWFSTSIALLVVGIVELGFFVILTILWERS